MKIKPVSQLDPKTLTTIPELMQQGSYIETSFLSGVVNDELSLYNSYKLRFDQYNAAISGLVDDVKDYVDQRCKELSDLINDLSATVLERLHQADLSIENFMHETDNIFLHKKAGYVDPVTGDKEFVYGIKAFVDTVHMKGNSAMLTADTVIEGTSRRSLWG